MLGFNKSKKKDRNDDSFLDSVSQYVKRNRRNKWGDYEKSDHEVEAPVKRKKRSNHSFPHLLNKQYKVPKYKYREFFTTERPSLPGNFIKSIDSKNTK